MSCTESIRLKVGLSIKYLIIYLSYYIHPHKWELYSYYTYGGKYLWTDLEWFLGYTVQWKNKVQKNIYR